MIILIGGPSGSGKTSLSVKLVKHYESLGKSVVCVSLDDFYRDFSHIADVNERAEKVNFDHPDSVDRELLHSVVARLIKGEVCQLPEHDYHLHTRKPSTREVNPASVEVFIFEGIFALNAQVGLLALVDSLGQSVVPVYMDTHYGLCAVRRFERDVSLGRSPEAVFKQYREMVLPMQQVHVEPTKQYAEVLLEDSHDLSSLMSYVAGLSRDELAVVNEKLASIKTSVSGLFGGWMSYATQQMERADRVAHDFLMAEVHPEAKVPGGPK